MSAKDIIVKPISSSDAKKCVLAFHYSMKVVPNSQLHLGVFYNNKLEGVMSFGASMDKKRMVKLVKNTKFNDFLELNRMAFSDKLPRNSESRALSVAFKIIKKKYPNIEWIVSFADGTQCGDGTIYRASGFYLVGIKKNCTLLKMPDGKIISKKTLDNDIGENGNYKSSIAKKMGAKPLDGFQLKYIYFLNKESKKNLTVPILQFNKIDEIKGRMYKGKRVVSSDNAAPGFQSGEGGASPTTTLQAL